MCLFGAQILYGQVLLLGHLGGIKNQYTNLLFSYVHFLLLRIHSVCGEAKIIKYSLWPEYILAINYVPTLFSIIVVTY